jgi:hypothetical protein
MNFAVDIGEQKPRWSVVAENIFFFNIAATFAKMYQ